VIAIALVAALEELAVQLVDDDGDPDRRSLVRRRDG
jgi:hypothetical protein